jgi:hypothetical protein
MHNTSTFQSPSGSFRDPQANTTLNTSSFCNDSILSGVVSVDEWPRRPDCWSDDVRMNALFAPFRSRDLNPLHYDNKLRFWKELIVDYCTDNQILQFDSRTIENLFKRKNMRPKCLDLVISELAKEKVIATREEIVKPRVGFIQNVLNKGIFYFNEPKNEILILKLLNLGQNRE